jgi:hypothetical protein
MEGLLSSLLMPETHPSKRRFFLRVFAEARSRIEEMQRPSGA